MGEKFLNKAYELQSVEETRALYDNWSDSYDSELLENGYATPRRVAEALAKYADKNKPVLDYGCGTGLCGLTLKEAGFETLDGADLSQEMLEIAKKKNVYRKLTHIDPNIPLAISPGDYSAITACGVIGIGGAPLSVFDTIVSFLDKKGLFAFSFNDTSLSDPCYEAKVMEYTDCGFARLLFREHGEHLPGINLKSMVYVIQKN
ncbi:methyltransferase domain-containing protein [Pseudohalocynthiibacter sp. F2068]|jgi:predicted TPR repeat methyltransferase|uniref:class I SAM-dependent DNA methyltransferase n=1 Tax=Pseudohalocynthiibacter sp. F2068 TaxID=2926418 RepID=UPI001FF36121|nr:methyltransferase domain-containing protein [Pseudohalocynthiibacter sp. F2068]MCK0101003.1 methyltransferase domain-containing protein [Pseudohalocynthiibacter sp. F2068]